MDEKRLEELFSDQKFVDALGAADKAEEVVRIFAENGVEMSTEEAEKFLEGCANGAQSGELNEDELDAVAGGWGNWYARYASTSLGHGFRDGIGNSGPDRIGLWYGVGYVCGRMYRTLRR